MEEASCAVGFVPARTRTQALDVRTVRIAVFESCGIATRYRSIAG